MNLTKKLQLVTTKTANQPRSSRTTSNHPKSYSTTRNHQQSAENHPKPPQNHSKLSKTTWNYLKPIQNFLKLVITSPKPLEPPVTPAQQTINFYLVFLLLSLSMNWFIVRKVKKMKKTLAMIINHKLWILSHSYGRSL